MADLQKNLKAHWGFDALRPLQQKAVDAILAKRDVTVLLPTGGGKSLCYQLPAVSLPGLAIVVSPLISLMQDQVNQLKKRKVKALHLSGSLSPQQLDQRITNAALGGYKLLYVSPERLQTEWLLERLRQMEISFIAVDEAHCISQWGYDFRPSYLNIKVLREALPDLPIMALTATATNQVLSDVEKELELRNPVQIRDSFFRQNLSITMLASERKEARCMAMLQKTTGATIIYLRSRKKTEVFAKYLNEAGISAAHYHAGMEPIARQQTQQAWMNNQTRVMVATTAFGMGIDKSDVRLVFHLDLPDSPESYYQEIGRAGRDGKLAHCILLYSEADTANLEKGHLDEPSIQVIRQIYTAFCNQNNIAVGAGQYTENAFHLYPFSAKYGFASRHVHQALSLLDRSGIIKYEDVSSRPSVFRFIYKAEELYSFQIKNPTLEPIVKAILRLYGGVISYVTDIYEEQIALKTGYTVKRVQKLLEVLVKRGIAFYKPRYHGTTVVLLTERMSEKHLSVDHRLLKLRVEGKEKRAKAMLGLLENQSVCRMQELVAYFAERTSRVCGVCDVCKKDALRTLQTRILELLKEGEIELSALPQKFPETTKHNLSGAVRGLMDQGVVDLSENSMLSLI